MMQIDKRLQWHFLDTHRLYTLPNIQTGGKAIALYLFPEINRVLREGEPRISVLDIVKEAAEFGGYEFVGIDKTEFPAKKFSRPRRVEQFYRNPKHPESLGTSSQSPASLP